MPSLRNGWAGKAESIHWELVNLGYVLFDKCSFEFISLRTRAVFGPTPSHYRPRSITLNTISFETIHAHHFHHLTDQRTYRVASSSMLVPLPGSSAFLLSAASISLRASSPISSGFSNCLDPSGASVDVLVPACAMSFRACFRSRCTRK